MNEYLKAADDAKRLLAGFRGVAALADAFEKVGQLQQAETEAATSLAALRDQIAKATEELADLKADQAKAKKAAKEVTENAKENTDGLLADAKAQADKIVNDAQAVAEATVATAKHTAEELAGEASAAIAKRDAATAELVEIEKKIDAAKAKIAKMLG